MFIVLFVFFGKLVLGVVYVMVYSMFVSVFGFCVN